MAQPQRRRPAPGPDKQEERPLAELSALTGVSRFTLARAAKDENLEARKLGSQWVTTLAAVEAWLKDAAHRPGRRPQRKPRPVAPPPPREREGEALAA